MTQKRYKVLVVGASAGGMEFFKELLHALPADFAIPIVSVLHLSQDSSGSWANILNRDTPLKVKIAEDQDPLKNGVVYLAPPGYHLLIESNFVLSFSSDDYVNYARPSIDVLFETAAYSLGESVIACLGTGGNSDGAQGLKKIKDRGGYCIVQDPIDAPFQVMPESALKLVSPQAVLMARDIPTKLLELIQNKARENES